MAWARPAFIDAHPLRHPADFSIVLLEKNYHLHITVWLAIVVIGILTKKIFNVSYAKSRNGGMQTRKSYGVSHGKFKTCGKQTQELLIVSQEDLINSWDASAEKLHCLPKTTGIFIFSR